MSTVQDIEQAILRLPPQDRALLRAWFAQLDADQWDRQFEADVQAGRLDSLGKQALAEFKAGNCTEL